MRENKQKLFLSRNGCLLLALAFLLHCAPALAAEVCDKRTFDLIKQRRDLKAGTPLHPEVVEGIVKRYEPAAAAAAADPRSALASELAPFKFEPSPPKHELAPVRQIADSEPLAPARVIEAKAEPKAQQITAEPKPPPASQNTEQLARAATAQATTERDLIRSGQMDAKLAERTRREVEATLRDLKHPPSDSAEWKNKEFWQAHLEQAQAEQEKAEGLRRYFLRVNEDLERLDGPELAAARRIESEIKFAEERSRVIAASLENLDVRHAGDSGSNMRLSAVEMERVNVTDVRLTQHAIGFAQVDARLERMAAQAKNFEELQELARKLATRELAAVRGPGFHGEGGNRVYLLDGHHAARRLFLLQHAPYEKLPEAVKAKMSREQQKILREDKKLRLTAMVQKTYASPQEMALDFARQGKGLLPEATEEKYANLIAKARDGRRLSSAESEELVKVYGSTARHLDDLVDDPVRSALGRVFHDLELPENMRDYSQFALARGAMADKIATLKITNENALTPRLQAQLRDLLLNDPECLKELRALAKSGTNEEGLRFRTLNDAQIDRALTLRSRELGRELDQVVSSGYDVGEKGKITGNLRLPNELKARASLEAAATVWEEARPGQKFLARMAEAAESGKASGKLVEEAEAVRARLKAVRSLCEALCTDSTQVKQLDFTTAVLGDFIDAERWGRRRDVRQYAGNFLSEAGGKQLRRIDEEVAAMKPASQAQLERRVNRFVERARATTARTTLDDDSLKELRRDLSRLNAVELTHSLGPAAHDADKRNFTAARAFYDRLGKIHDNMDKAAWEGRGVTPHHLSKTEKARLTRLLDHFSPAENSKMRLSAVSESVPPPRQIHVVLDIDGNFAHLLKKGEDLPTGFKAYTANGDTYIVPDSFVRKIESLLDPAKNKGVDVQLSFFSGGLPARNLELLSKIPVTRPDGSKAFLADVAAKNAEGKPLILSRPDITYVRSEVDKVEALRPGMVPDGAKFLDEQRLATMKPFSGMWMSKDLEKITKDLSKVVLIDDHVLFSGIKSQTGNLIRSVASKEHPVLTRLDWEGRLAGLIDHAVDNAARGEDVRTGLVQRQFRITRTPEGFELKPDFSRYYANNRNLPGGAREPAAAMANSNSPIRKLAERYGVWKQEGDAEALTKLNAELRAINQPELTPAQLRSNLWESFLLDRIDRLGKSNGERVEALSRDLEHIGQPVLAHDERRAVEAGINASRKKILDRGGNGRIMEYTREESRLARQAFIEAYELIRPGKGDRAGRLADTCLAGALCAAQGPSVAIRSDINPVKGMAKMEGGNLRLSAVAGAVVEAKSSEAERALASRLQKIYSGQAPAALRDPATAAWADKKMVALRSAEDAYFELQNSRNPLKLLQREKAADALLERAGELFRKLGYEAKIETLPSGDAAAKAHRALKITSAPEGSGVLRRAMENDALARAATPNRKLQPLSFFYDPAIGASSGRFSSEQSAVLRKRLRPDIGRTGDIMVLHELSHGEVEKYHSLRVAMAAGLPELEQKLQRRNERLLQKNYDFYESRARIRGNGSVDTEGYNDLLFVEELHTFERTVKQLEAQHRDAAFITRHLGSDALPPSLRNIINEEGLKKTKQLYSGMATNASKAYAEALRRFENGELARELKFSGRPGLVTAELSMHGVFGARKFGAEADAVLAFPLYASKGASDPENLHLLGDFLRRGAKLSAYHNSDATKLAARPIPERVAREPSSNLRLSAVEFRGSTLHTAAALEEAAPEVQAAVHYRTAIEAGRSERHVEALLGDAKTNSSLDRERDRYGNGPSLRVGLLHEEEGYRARRLAEAKAELAEAARAHPAGHPERLRREQELAERQRAYASAALQLAGESRARQAELATTKPVVGAQRSSLEKFLARTFDDQKARFEGLKLKDVAGNGEEARLLSRLREKEARAVQASARETRAAVADALAPLAKGDQTVASKLARELQNAHEAAAARKTAPEREAALKQSLSEQGWTRERIASCSELGLCGVRQEPAATMPEAGASLLARELNYSEELARAGTSAREAQAVMPAPAAKSREELVKAQAALDEELRTLATSGPISADAQLAVQKAKEAVEKKLAEPALEPKAQLTTAEPKKPLLSAEERAQKAAEELKKLDGEAVKADRKPAALVSPERAAATVTADRAAAIMRENGADLDKALLEKLAKSAQKLEKGEKETDVLRAARDLVALNRDPDMLDNAARAYVFAGDIRAADKTGKLTREQAAEAGIKRMLSEAGFTKTEINAPDGIYAQTIACWKL